MALPKVGKKQNGQSSLVSRIARGIFDGTRQSAAKAASASTSTARAVVSGIKDIVQPENLLKAAVGDNQLGQSIINKIFNDNKTVNNTETTTNTETGNARQDTSAPSEVLDKLTQIDAHIVELGDRISTSGKSIERMVYQTTEAQTIVLTKGVGYNIVNENRPTFNPLGLPGDRIVPALPSVIRNNTGTAIAHRNVNDILAREDNKHDDEVAEKQADDISAIRLLLENQAKEGSKQDKQKTLAEKMTDKLLGNDDDIDVDIRRSKGRRPGRPKGRGRGRLGRFGRGLRSIGGRAASMIRAAPVVLSTAAKNTGQMASQGISATTKSVGQLASRSISAAGNIARPALSTAVNVGRGAASLIGGIGAGTAAAGTAALLFGGTGLYAAYKAAKGEDASTWASDLVDKGVQAATGDKDTSLGSKIYDWLHPEESQEHSPQTIVKSPTTQPTIVPAKEMMLNRLIGKQSPTPMPNKLKAANTIATTASNTMVATPEPLPDAKRLESNKLEAESKTETPPPVVVNVPQQSPQQQRISQGHGGGQSLAPMLTRPTDSSLNRATDKMIRGSL